jgi:hypothetical protein
MKYVIICSLFVLVACSKDNNPPEEQPEAEKMLLVSGYIFYDHRLDIKEQYEVTYTADSCIYEIKSPLANTPGHFSVRRFIYENGKLIKELEYKTTASTEIRTARKLEYEGGRLVRIDTYHPDFSTYDKYDSITYKGADTVPAVVYRFYPGGPFAYRYVNEWQNGNLIQVKEYKGDGTKLLNTATLTYENTPNYLRIYGKNRLWYLSDDPGQYAMYFSRDNLVRSAERSETTGTTYMDDEFTFYMDEGKKRLDSMHLHNVYITGPAPDITEQGTKFLYKD